MKISYTVLSNSGNKPSQPPQQLSSTSTDVNNEKRKVSESHRSFENNKQFETGCDSSFTETQNDSVKPPVLVTSIDFSDMNKKFGPLSASKSTSSSEKSKRPSTPAEPEPTSFSPADGMSSIVSNKIDSKIQNFGNSLKSNGIDKELVIFKHDLSPMSEGDKKIERQSFVSTPQQIHSTLNDIYPPPSPDVETSFLSSSIKSGKKGIERFNDSNHPSIEEKKDQKVSFLPKSATLENLSPVNKPFEEREKEYLVHLNQYYDDRSTAARDDDKRNGKPVSRAVVPTSDVDNEQQYLKNDSDDIYADQNTDFQQLRHAIKPVTTKELEEALEMLKFDIHCEIQEVLREQVRQFNIAKVVLVRRYPLFCLSFSVFSLSGRNCSDDERVIKSAEGACELESRAERRE
jgi:hypothetical protein